MCCTKGYGFLHCFGLKTGIDFAQFSLESGKVFIGTTEVYEIRFVGVLIQVMVTWYVKNYFFWAEIGSG